jgi:hypothetical protein
MAANKSIYKGYPFGPPKSRELFPVEERPSGQEIDAIIQEDTMISPSLIAKYSQALHEAEGQVYEMQRRYPFIPEDYNFVKINDYENRWSSFDRNITIFNHKDDLWLIKIDEATFVDEDGNKINSISNQEIEIQIQDEQEAYLAFKLLGVISSLEKPKENELEHGSELVGSPIELVLNNTTPEVQRELQENNVRLSLDSEQENNSAPHPEPGVETNEN